MDNDVIPRNLLGWPPLGRPAAIVAQLCLEQRGGARNLPCSANR